MIDARAVRLELLLLGIGERHPGVVAAELVPRIDQQLDHVLFVVEIAQGPGELHFGVFVRDPRHAPVRLDDLCDELRFLRGRRLHNRKLHAALDLEQLRFPVIEDGRDVRSEAHLLGVEIAILILIAATERERRAAERDAQRERR